MSSATNCRIFAVQVSGRLPAGGRGRGTGDGGGELLLTFFFGRLRLGSPKFIPCVCRRSYRYTRNRATASIKGVFPQAATRNLLVSGTFRRIKSKRDQRTFPRKCWQARVICGRFCSRSPDVNASTLTWHVPLTVTRTPRTVSASTLLTDRVISSKLRCSTRSEGGNSNATNTEGVLRGDNFTLRRRL